MKGSACTAFCVDQIDGLPERYYARPAATPVLVERNAAADAFFTNTGAVVRHGGTQAFYAPSTDHIQKPPIESFRDAASYVAVRAHETVQRPPRIASTATSAAITRIEANARARN